MELAATIKTMKKGIIEFVEKIQIGSYVKGTNFVKGDYIPLETSFIARVKGLGQVEIPREGILKNFPGRIRITDKLLASLKGMDITKFIK